MTGREKRRARRHACLMMFQYEMTGSSPQEVARRYWSDVKETPSVMEMANALFEGAVKSLDRTTDILSKCLRRGWKPSRLFSLDRSILKVAIYELTEKSFSPAPAVINDAVEIAKEYGGDERSPALVNAILDRVAKEFKGER